MRKITLQDEKNDKYNMINVYTISEDIEDETETIYEVINTLLTNKYQYMDDKKIVEEIIYQSKVYETINELIKTIRSEPGLKHIHDQYPIIETREEETINWNEIL